MKPLLIINDHKKIDEVYKKSEEYLKNHDRLRDKIATHLWAYNEAGVLVPQTVESFWSGHFFPFSESYYELENSFELCKQGFYRYSFFALRCVLELVVIGLYFDKDDQAHIDVQKWLQSKEPTPYFKPILKRLFQLEHFGQFNERHNLQTEISDIYSLQNNYVHTRGYRYSTSGQSISNFNQFNEKSFLRYIQCMEKTVRSSIVMMFLKYPIGMQNLPIWEKFGFDIPMGGLLDESSQEAIFVVLDEGTKAILQKISDNDPTVQAIVEGITNIPDLTEEQLKQQSAEQDKWYEEHRRKD